MTEPEFERDLRVLAERLTIELGNSSLVPMTLQAIRDRAPDERLTLAFLLQLAEMSPSLLAEALRDQRRADDLIFCLGGSELIATGLITSGVEWVSLLDQARLQNSSSSADSPPIEFASTEMLGAFKQRTLLRIAIRDLLGRAAVSETVKEMSWLADACIHGALTIASRESQNVVRANEFCVLAMGKLGANELNLSSDVDLVYLFDDDDPAHLEWAQHFGKKLTGIISMHCFRVDMRLRPGGRVAPLVSSVAGSLGFYESFGQTWERAALLRARPVAGAIPVGQRLITELARFIYRSYLDFDTIRELRAMKRQIEDELRSPDLIQRNIKLGYGGIRELEFIVQALVLIYGGRDPRLRTANTLAALERLESCGYMAESVASALHDAYLFLRNVEHKLQVAAGLQTHTLPTDPVALRVLAARLGYGKDHDAVSRFERDLRSHRELVAEQFRQMLSGDDHESRTQPPPLAQEAWKAALDPLASAPILEQIGFPRATESARNLELLARGPVHASLSERRREALERLGPILLEELRGLPDPDLALMNLASFMMAVGARTSFLALLEQHPATRRVLLRLFASSTYLSTLFIQHPEMIDTLVRSDLAKVRRPQSELAAELRAILAASADFESRLNALRVFRHQEFLRIAIADLAGEFEIEEVETELTILADTVVAAAMMQARLEVEQRAPISPELKLCAMAMGRLGAGQMTYNSDLDLIFIYHLPNEHAAEGRVAAARIVQKLIAILEAPTREGYAYKLDLRLRPSGNAGPLVSTLDGFREYHRLSSALWERQALVRGRVIAGDEWLSREVELERQTFVFRSGLKPQGVAEILSMRRRIENELGQESATKLNLKQGPGGLFDVDFLAQMMALRHGEDHAALRVRDTLSLLHAIAAARLMPSGEIESLLDDYRFLTKLENRLRIESDHAVSALPTALDALTPIARRTGYAASNAASELLAALRLRRARVRTIFDMCFARETVN